MKITIMDTTLRDGEQTSGVSFTDEEKLSIAKLLLDELKVDRIEVASALVSEGELEAVISEVFSEHQNVVEELRGGKEKAFGFLVGQVMKKTKGKANPKLANRLLKEKIGGLQDVEQ